MNHYQIQIKTGPRKWTSAGSGSFSSLEVAQDRARDFDEDGLLINVRIVCPGGNIVTPASVNAW